MAEQAGNCTNLVGSSEDRFLPRLGPNVYVNYFKITSVGAYYNLFLFILIRIGLARTEVYECNIYTRRDKTCYYYHILLSYHRMCGGCH